MDSTTIASTDDLRQPRTLDTSVLPHCEVCGDLFGSEPLVACLRCNSPFHRDCFRHVGTCATYGCGCTTSVPWLPEPTSQALQHSLTARLVDRARKAPVQTGSRGQLRQSGSSRSRGARAERPAPARKPKKPRPQAHAASCRPKKSAQPQANPEDCIWDSLLKRAYKHPKGTFRGDWERFHRPVSDPLCGLLFMIGSVTSPFLAPVTPGTCIAVPLAFLFGILICLQHD